MDSEISKRFTEVYEILKYLPKTDFEKIPKNILNFIIENKDNNYTWKIDKTKKLYEQKLSNDTIAILSYINMEFIVTDEQKQYLKKLYAYHEYKKENEKKDNSNYSDIFPKEEKIKNNKIIEYHKESFWTIILKKIKSICFRDYGKK